MRQNKKNCTEVGKKSIKRNGKLDRREIFCYTAAIFLLIFKRERQIDYVIENGKRLLSTTKAADKRNA